MIDQLKFIYDAGETRRFHTVSILRDQNIADHSWHVAMLGYTLYGQTEPGVTIAFLMACLTHDMAECRVGDLPAPAKRGMAEHFDDFREKWDAMEQSILATVGMNWEYLLTEEEKRRLKLCDALEGLFHCIRERQLGNKTIVTCFLNFTEYVGRLLEDIGDVPFNKDNLTPDEAASHREWYAFEFTQNLWRAAGE